MLLSAAAHAQVSQMRELSVARGEPAAPEQDLFLDPENRRERGWRIDRDGRLSELDRRNRPTIERTRFMEVVGDRVIFGRASIVDGTMQITERHELPRKKFEENLQQLVAKKAVSPGMAKAYCDVSGTDMEDLVFPKARKPAEIRTQAAGFNLGDIF